MYAAHGRHPYHTPRDPDRNVLMKGPPRPTRRNFTLFLCPRSDPGTGGVRRARDRNYSASMRAKPLATRSSAAWAPPLAPSPCASTAQACSVSPAAENVVTTTERR